MNIIENGDDIKIELEEDDYTNRRQHLVDGLSAHKYMEMESMSDEEWAEWLIGAVTRSIKLDRKKQEIIDKAYAESMNSGVVHYNSLEDFSSGQRTGSSQLMNKIWSGEIEISSTPLVIKPERSVPADLDAQFQAWVNGGKS
jgi:hypothetical protein